MAWRNSAKKQGWPVTFYTADELRAVPGQFAHSDFVQSITGVDNVCERAAVLAAGGPVGRTNGRGTV